MYTRSRTRPAWLSPNGSLVVFWLIFALRGLSYANADPPAHVGESVLFDGSQKLISPEEPRDAQRSKRTENRVERRAKASLQKAISPPQVIPVPSDIPLYKEDGARIVFPKHGYEQMYFEGWNECLYVIGNTNTEIRGEIMSSCLTSFNNNLASGAGLVDGCRDCQRRIIFLASIYNLDLIRKTAKELHREIPGGVAWERKKTDKAR